MVNLLENYIGQFDEFSDWLESFFGSRFKVGRIRICNTANGSGFDMDKDVKVELLKDSDVFLKRTRISVPWSNGLSFLFEVDLDLSGVRASESHLGSMMNETSISHTLCDSTSQWDAYINHILIDYKTDIMFIKLTNDKEARDNLIEKLSNTGIFTIRGSVERIAKVLDVSVGTLYNTIKTEKIG